MQAKKSRRKGGGPPKKGTVLTSPMVCYSTGEDPRPPKGGEPLPQVYERPRQARWDRRNLRTISTHVSSEEAVRLSRLCQDRGTTVYHLMKAYALSVLEGTDHDHAGPSYNGWFGCSATR